MALQNRAHALPLAASLVFLAACGGGGYGGGSVPIVPQFNEVEENGHPSNANYIGPVSVGDYFVIHGDVSELYADWFDGFWMYATEDVDVEFVLSYSNPFADLDVGWFAPANQGYVQNWETSYNPEVGILPLYANEDFHLVVSPWTGSSSYQLEVIGHPIGYGASQPPAPVTPVTAAATAARVRKVPFERYHTPEPALEAEARPLAEGLVIEIDPQDGSVRSRAFELSSEGLRIGPVRLEGGR
jgi:hypothetical protein